MVINILFINLKGNGFTAPFIDTDYNLLVREETKSDRFVTMRIEIPVKDLGAGGNVDGRVGVVIKEIGTWMDWADVVYVWFADIHAWGAMKLASSLWNLGINRNRPRFIVVVGGYEVDSVQEFPEYGSINSWKRYIVRSVLNSADLILVPSQYLKHKLYDNYPKTTTPVAILPLGFDPEKYPRGTKKKENTVLSVTVANNKHDAEMKGANEFIRVARWFLSRSPGISFSLVGIGPRIYDYINGIAPDNLEVVPVITHGELIKRYQEAEVYCQFSFTEAFGASLAESMLCGCIPVFREAGAMMGTTGGRGEHFWFTDPKSIIFGLMQAKQETPAEDAREWISTHYSLNMRKEALFGFIGEVCRT